MEKNTRRTKYLRISLSLFSLWRSLSLRPQRGGLLVPVLSGPGSAAFADSSDGRSEPMRPVRHFVRLVRRLVPGFVGWGFMLPVSLGLGVSFAAWGAEKGALERQFSPSTLAEPAQILDDGPYAAFLDRYVREGEGIHWVDYGGVSAADRAALRGYIDTLTQMDPSPENLTRAQQVAYWINLYNAVTLDVVLDFYPVETIRDIRLGGFLSPGPWGRELVTVSGLDLSLDDIEHTILRGIFGEIRVHYAVNCASYSCPNLLERPWRAETLEEDLEAAARYYVNSPQGVWFDEEGKPQVSSIYHWYSEDFGETKAEVLDHIRLFASPELRKKLEPYSTYDDHDYDWSLNDLARLSDDGSLSDGS